MKADGTIPKVLDESDNWHEAPKIFGNYVVWTDYRNDNSDIYLSREKSLRLDKNTDIRITNGVLFVAAGFLISLTYLGSPV